ncbi:ficolin-1-like [Saccostrea cucullata]|uniref:ficolin-1-like n=1 Tax=Saccostrea cuccullata TaxID=36930 RepID=UPI002ED651F8
MYDGFSVSDETDKYQLFLAGPATGTLGDSMLNTGYAGADLSGMYFSTPERDNDGSSKNCAALSNHRGGWWFNNCNWAFLNGQLYPTISYCKWCYTLEIGASIRETMMMIRRH